MCTLITGAILSPGARTVTAALRVMGLEHAKDFSNYHEVLNRAQWSALLMSRILLSLLVRAFVPDEAVLRLVVDDTLERRRGRKVRYKGVFRDPVLSTETYVTLNWGIRWVCLCVLAPVPWSSRPWALPFLCVPALSEKRCQQLRKPYRSPSQWAAVLLERVRRWHPGREIELVADGGYASQELVHLCQQKGIRFISRLRMDAVLYDEPGPRSPSKRGPKPKKGARQPRFAERLADVSLRWQPATIRWYAGQTQHIEFLSGVSLWHRVGEEPVRLRWILLRPSGAAGAAGAAGSTGFRPAALLCSDLDLSEEEIVTRFLLRWNIEVTFEEMRASLGWETQRHWSDKAVGRTTPCLFGLFSLVTLAAKSLHPQTLPKQTAEWYEKKEPSFRDALAAVRMHLWTQGNYINCASIGQQRLIPATLLPTLVRAVCYAS
jgi:hypothetical protein